MYTGTTRATFHACSWWPVLKDREKRRAIGPATSVAHSLSTQAGILSGPVALEESSLARCRRTVSARKWILVTAGVSLSTEAAGRLSTDMSEAGLHFLEKKEPKKFAFGRSDEHSCPCASIRAGISEERLTPATDFITDHHCLSRR